MESIIQKEKECFICGRTTGLHLHHCLSGTANRRLSEKYGLKIFLCWEHHNGSNNSVHHNRELELAVKQLGQSHFELTHTREEFRAIFGKSFL